MNPDDTSRALVILAAVDIIVTAVLIWAAHRERNPALTERAFNSVILTSVAVGAAALGLARLKIIAIPNEAAILILSAGLLAVSLPQIVWFAMYLAGKFR